MVILPIDDRDARDPGRKLPDKCQSGKARANHDDVAVVPARGEKWCGRDGREKRKHAAKRREKSTGTHVTLVNR